jgi:hypothetical protein
MRTNIGVSLALLWGTALLVMQSSATAQTGPVISTLTPTSGTAGGTLFVVLPIANTGSATAGSLQVTSATLSTAILLTPSLPLAVGDLVQGNSYQVTLTFNASTLTAGKNYLLVVRGTCQGPSGLEGFSVNRIISYGASPFGKAPNPLTVAPLLDNMHSTTQVVSAANGGVVSITGADGSVFTLTIPPNALLSDEAVSMTPLTAVVGLPISGGLLAGVQLGPDGLQLQQPATLTILPSTTAPVNQEVGFGFHNNGLEFYFQPLGLSSTITVSLMHFSGAGVGQGTPGNGGNPTNAVDQLVQEAQQIINQERGCQLLGIGCGNQDFNQELEGLFQEFYEEVVSPLVQAALTDDSQAQNALDTALAWAREASLLLNQTEPIASEIALLINTQVPAILENVYNKAYNRCLGDSSQGQRMIEAQKMITAYRELQLIGGGTVFPNFETQIGACIAGALTFTFDSTVIGAQAAPGTPTFNSNSTVDAQQVPLTFDSAGLMYTGNGTLNYDSRIFSIDWNLPVTDCSSGVGNPGTIGVTAKFDLNVSPLSISSPSQLRLNVAVMPMVSETDTYCFINSDGLTVSQSLTDGNYATFLAIAHGGTGSDDFPPSPYFVDLNTQQTFNLSGTSSAGGLNFTASESSTLTLSQANP